MNEQAQNIAIAEACGYWDVKPIYSTHRFELGDSDKPKLIGIIGKYDQPTNCQPWIPEYTKDLNACHEMEKCLQHDSNTGSDFCDYLDTVINSACCEPAHPSGYGTGMNATAAQRAEAFLRTIGKWEDE